MLIANVGRSWPSVQAGDMSAEQSVMGWWASLNEAKLHQFADGILGVAGGRVVAAFDITSWSREEDRVRFQGPSSTRWAHLIGSPSPVQWQRGAARPIRYLATGELDQLAGQDVDDNRDRMSLRGWTLQLDVEGNGTLTMPAGTRISIIPT